MEDKDKQVDTDKTQEKERVWKQLEAQPAAAASKANRKGGKAKPSTKTPPKEDPAPNVVVEKVVTKPTTPKPKGGLQTVIITTPYANSATLNGQPLRKVNAVKRFETKVQPGTYKATLFDQYGNTCGSANIKVTTTGSASKRINCKP